MARIVVTPAEEDEVIVAGAVSEAAPDAAPEPAPEPAHEPAAAPARPRRAPAERDPYREATLDDLESQPMPLAQRIVIIAAVVCIIGALVYYFVAMR